MADIRKTKAKGPGKPRYADDAHAPFSFFDGVPNSGALEGVITITLSAKAMLPSADHSSVDVRDLAVAYLRCSRRAAIALKQAIDNALLIGARTRGSEH